VIPLGIPLSGTQLELTVCEFFVLLQILDVDDSRSLSFSEVNHCALPVFRR
jgi:hypothetical protein